MTMPLDLVLVRHGESEGNVATKLSKQGDDSLFTPEFLQTHSLYWDLTPRGIEQAKEAAEWFKNHPDLHFNRFYVSEYVRAMRTALLLDLPNARWYPYFVLHERDWGEFDVVTYGDKERILPNHSEKRHKDPFYFTPPNGESMTQLCLRTKDVLGTLHRECTDKRVIIVCHGEVMWSFRVNLERFTTQRFRELDHSKDPFDRIHNCQILHYTRINPVTGDLSTHLDWMRSICPWDTSLSSNEWQKIERPKFTNEGLHDEIDRMLDWAREGTILK